MKSPKPRRKILLGLNQGVGLYRDMILGIARAARVMGHWDIQAINADLSRSDLDVASFDGVIVRNQSWTITMPFLQAGKPTVNISSTWRDDRCSHVGTNDVAIGRLAAEHFLELGYRNLAYCGFPSWHFPLQRWKGFAERAREAGIEPQAFGVSKEDEETWSWDYETEADNIMHWLETLRLPAGVMACHDKRGRWVLSGARKLGLRVPEDLAVIGVDNDPIYCELSTPPLSSVKVPGRQIGYEGAMLLEQIISGKVKENRVQLLDPVGVARRESTELLAVGDPELTAAIRFIRSHAHQPINVSNVVEHTSLSRRMLEKRFRKLLDRSILQEIRHAHLSRARELLAETDLTVSQVAEHCGFTSGEYFATSFSKTFGCSPTQWRSQFTSGPAPS